MEVWLPSDYSNKKKYAVLYMHDGQMLFDSTTTWNRQEWGVDETMGRLLAEKKIRNCIVVGIANNGPHRYEEYLPQKAAGFIGDSAKKELMQRVPGRLRADDYLRFLITELKPFVDSAYSTHRDQSNTFVAGSSMGGLISMYALCEYPQVFGGAACISTHWPGSFATEPNPVSEAILRYFKENLPPPKNHLFYFDYGTATLDASYAPFQKAVDEVMKQKGYTSKNWLTKEFPGENHSEEAWKKRFDQPLIFLLGK